MFVCALQCVTSNRVRQQDCLRGRLSLAAHTRTRTRLLLQGAQEQLADAQAKAAEGAAAKEQLNQVRVAGWRCQGLFAAGMLCRACARACCVCMPGVAARRPSASMR